MRAFTPIKVSDLPSGTIFRIVYRSFGEWIAHTNYYQVAEFQDQYHLSQSVRCFKRFTREVVRVHSDNMAEVIEDLDVFRGF